MKVSLAYATPEQQFWMDLDLAEGCNLVHAIHQSNIISLFPQIDLEKQKVGIFGRVVGLDQILVEGDRIEIYRPITWKPDEDEDDDE